MHWIWLIFAVIVLAFCGVVYAGYRAWPRMSSGRRIAGTLLLVPHFLLIVCSVVSLIYGNAPQGSTCFNRAFFCDVMIMFILPVPTLVGTIVALILFKLA